VREGLSLRPPLDILDISRAIRRQAIALGVPDHLAQGFHEFMMGIVLRATALGQQLEGATECRGAGRWRSVP
jgi:hypothetical protein